MTSENPSSSATDRFVLGLWWIALILKLALGAVIPLAADEAYYWVWSKHLALSYYDHPPFVGWLFWISQPFEAFAHTVRWPSILLGHLTALIWFRLLASLGASDKSPLWFLFFMLCPLTGLGGMIITPDLPLLFFWSLSLLCLFRFMQSQNPSWAWSLGLALGLGFCSKYQIVLLPFSLLPALAWKEIRLQLPRGFWIRTFVGGLAASSPVLLWNASHEWISFQFQLAHGLHSGRFSWQWPFEYLLGHALLVFPSLLWAARQPQAPSFRFLLWLCGFGPLAFFWISSFRAPSELNWPVMAYPALFALAALSASRRAWVPAALFWGSLHLLIPLIVFVAPQRFPLHEKIAEPYRFQRLKELPLEAAPLFTSSYQLASSLWYATRTPVYKLAGMNRKDMFDFWELSVPQGDFFYLLRDETLRLPPAYKNWSIEVVEKPAPGLELLKVSRP